METEFKLEELTTVIRGGFLVPKNDSHISTWQQECQKLDHCTHLPGVLAEHLNSSDELVLDLGAYDGDLTCVMSRILSQTSMIIAAEASKLSFECLRHNCQFFQHKNVFPIHTCISDVCGSTASWESDPSGNLGASICKGIPDNLRHEGQTYLLSTSVDYLVHQAQGRKCALIKADIEGWEFKMLLGASTTLKRDRPKLILEINSSALLLQGDCAQDIYTLLGMAGYTWEILQKECTIDSPMYDLLCIPKPQ